MGFWGAAGKVLGDAAQDMIKQAQKKMERIEKYEEYFEHMTDDELKRKLKTTSDSERKQAIINVLKRRGY